MKRARKNSVSDRAKFEKPPVTSTKAQASNSETVINGYRRFFTNGDRAKLEKPAIEIRRVGWILDELMALHHISWQSYRFLSLGRVAKLREVSTGWNQALEHFLRSGYLIWDIQVELYAMGVKIGVPGLWRGMEEGQVLNYDDEPKIQAMVAFVARHCSALKTLRMLHGIEPWMVYLIRSCVSDMVIADIFLEEGEWQEDLGPLSDWVTRSWGSLRSLTLMTFYTPEHFGDLLNSIQATCRSLCHSHVRLELTRPTFQNKCANLLESWLLLPSLSSLGMAFALPDNFKTPTHVTAPLQSLQLGGPRPALTKQWHECIFNILPCLPHLKNLALSCIDICPRMGRFICSCSTIETLLLDACCTEFNIITLLAEYHDTGDVRWLPKLKTFQIQEGDDEIRRREIPGWQGLVKRPGLQVSPERFQIEYLEDHDQIWKGLWHEQRCG